MDLLLVSGFLGAGKTSLLLRLCDALGRRQGRRIAIVENEIGQVGIDDAVLEHTGLPVREIYSGCICCSLRVDLVTTLLALERELAPDLVIIEPSGVASPRQVVQSLQGYGGELERTLTLVLFDAPRLARIRDLSLPLFEAGIATADRILLSKSDLVEPAALTALTNLIREKRAAAPVMPISVETGEQFDTLVAWLESTLSRPLAPRSPARAAGPAVEDSTRGAVVVSRDCALAPCSDRDSQALRQRLADALTVLTKQLQDAGCTLIGHIKVILRGGGGYAVLSTTDFDQPPQEKGRLPHCLPEGRCTLNAIVYGVEKATAEALVDAVLAVL